MSKTAHDPLLTENPHRYVMFPIEDIDIWKSYKKQMDCFWRAEEIDFSKDHLHWDKLTKMCEREHYPFESPLHEIYNEELCISPVPSLAIHCTNVNSVFGLSPNINWKKLWEDNKV